MLHISILENQHVITVNFNINLLRNIISRDGQWYLQCLLHSYSISVLIQTGM